MQIIDHEGVVMTMAIGLDQVRMIRRQIVMAVNLGLGIGCGPNLRGNDECGKGEGGEGQGGDGERKRGPEPASERIGHEPAGMR